MAQRQNPALIYAMWQVKMAESAKNKLNSKDGARQLTKDEAQLLGELKTQFNEEFPED